MIQDVLLHPLKRIEHPKGDVLHMLRNDFPFYKQFGEVYFSWVNQGMVKGWKKHSQQSQHCVVPVGRVKFVLFDDRQISKTRGEIQEIDMGQDPYQLLRIPPQVWYAFGNISTQNSLITNCTDSPHDPEESIQKDLNDSSVPYIWKVDKE